MTKTVLKPTTKPTRKELIEKDKQRAEELMKVYAELNTEKERILEERADRMRPFVEQFEKQKALVDAEFNDRLEALTESIDSGEEELIRIGERRKALFKDNNWFFEDADGYYLHIKTETEVKTGPEFDLAKFIRKFPKLVDIKYRVAQLKKLFTDGDLRKQFDKFDIDLKLTEAVEIKQKKERA